MKTVSITILLAVILGALILANALFQPFMSLPVPGDFECLSAQAGHGERKSWEFRPRHIFGMGLTYAGHIRESAGIYKTGMRPPVFLKSASALNTENTVKLPSREDLLNQWRTVDAGFAEQVQSKVTDLPALMDYEVELGLVLLDDISRAQLRDPAFAPNIGFFIANDITARTIVVANETDATLNQYLGLSKSFPGFLPVNPEIWVPYVATPQSLLCTELTTRVNGEVRQRQKTSDLIYTPKEMLQFITEAYPDMELLKGDLVLTGTPAGIALQVPAWKQRLSQVVNLDRETKLAIVLGNNLENDRFLKAGDRVTVGATGFSEKTVQVIRAD